ncbi:MAG: AI-2E family transporter, partial [Thiolinea sp.]
MHSQNTLNRKALNFAALLLIIVLIGWLLIIGRTLLLPLILAMMIWYLLDNTARQLQSMSFGTHHIPYPVALAGAFMVMLVLILLVANMVAQNAVELAAQAGVYTNNIQIKLQSLLNTVAPKAEFRLDRLNDLFNLEKLVTWTTTLISNITSTLTLVISYLLFLFVEQTVFEQKFNALFDEPAKRDRAREVRMEIMQKIRIYLSVKTFVSVLTGVLSTLLLWWIGVDYAIFWGFIIFLLNYIPTIGSLLGVV